MSALYQIYKYVTVLKSKPFHSVVPLFNFVVDAVELSNNNRFSNIFFQQQEKKLVAEIKRTAKTGNEVLLLYYIQFQVIIFLCRPYSMVFLLLPQAATKILARQLIRLRQQISNLQGSRAQIRGIATHTQVKFSFFLLYSMLIVRLFLF
jgi:hypothetical protein